MLCALLLTDAVRAQAEPLAEKLRAGWRWRAIAGPDPARSFFHAVRPWSDNRLIAADEDGLAVFDGWEWQRQPGWQFSGVREITEILPFDEEHVLLATSRELRLLHHLHGERWRLATEMPADLTLPVRWPDGRILAGVNGQLTELTLQGGSPLAVGLPAGLRLLGLANDAQGRIYCLTNEALLRQEPDGWAALSAPPGFPGGPAWQVRLLRSAGELLVVASGVDAVTPAWRLVADTLVPLHDPVRALSVADAVLVADSLVLASRNPPLRLLEHETWVDVEPPLGLSESILSLAVTERHLAAVTASGQLFVCDLRSERWRAHDPAAVGIDRVINALAPAAAGGVWVGTADGIARFFENRFQDVHLTAGDGGERLRHVTTLAEDGDGALWVGSGSGFGGALRLAHGRWEQVELPGHGAQHVHRIRRLGDELYLMLIGSVYDGWPNGRVLRWSDGQLEELHDGPEARPLPRSYDILRTRDDRLLLGTLEGVLERSADRWVKLDGTGAFGGPYFVLHETAAGELWAGHGPRLPGAWTHAQDGWIRRDTAAWKRAAAADFCELPDGRLFFASEYGLFLGRDDECRNLSEQLPTRTFWPMLADGADGLWLGSLGSGLIRFRPDDITPPRVTRLEISFTETGEALAQWCAADAWNETPEERLTFRVLLDDEPVAARATHVSAGSPGHRLNLGRLSPGRHVLSVAAVDTPGNVQAQPRTHAFEVAPPAWRSPPALLGGVLALLGAGALAVVLLHRRRERQLAQRDATELTERLSTLTRRLFEAQEDERRQLSREMHDDLGQALTAVRLNIEGAGRTPDAEQRARELERACEGLARTLQRVRRISHGLRPLALDDHGLHEALIVLVEELGLPPGAPEVVLQADFDGNEVPPGIAAHCYRIVQESLTNALRHAGASRVLVAVDTTPGQIEIRVRDDGQGFEPERLPTRRRFGLLGLQERAELLGGRFRIASRPGAGTEVSVSIPYVWHRYPTAPDTADGKDGHG